MEVKPDFPAAWHYDVEGLAEYTVKGVFIFGYFATSNGFKHSPFSFVEDVIMDWIHVYFRWGAQEELQAKITLKYFMEPLIGKHVTKPGIREAVTTFVKQGTTNTTLKRAPGKAKSDK